MPLTSYTYRCTPILQPVWPSQKLTLQYRLHETASTSLGSNPHSFTSSSPHSLTSSLFSHSYTHRYLLLSRAFNTWRLFVAITKQVQTILISAPVHFHSCSHPCTLLHPHTPHIPHIPHIPHTTPTHPHTLTPLTLGMRLCLDVTHAKKSVLPINLSAYLVVWLNYPPNMKMIFVLGGG